MKLQILYVKLVWAYHYLVPTEQRLFGAVAADAAADSFWPMVCGAVRADEDVEKASVLINSPWTVSTCNAVPHTLIYTLVGRLWRSSTLEN